MTINYIGQTLKPGSPGPYLDLAVFCLACMMFSKSMKNRAFWLLLINPEAWAHLLPARHTLSLVPGCPEIMGAGQYFWVQGKDAGLQQEQKLSSITLASGS
jgi:hypothetical protein